MRTAIFSDMHGNDLAFETMLADAQGAAVDHYVCLGDAIQGGPQPAQVAARLRALGCPVVMGNADAWLLSGQETGSESISPERRRKLDAIREWSLEQLSAADREWIAAFQPTVELAVGGGRSLLAFHGSPASFDEVIFPVTPEAEFRQRLGAYVPRIMTGGHVHLPYVRRLDETFFFNPGSVGFAYNHEQEEASFRADAWAEYALLTIDGERVGLEFRRVPYDPAALIEVFAASGRPFAEDATAQYRAG
jgi:predicted phosphodiesterase